jgi:hypothetical protein
MSDPLLGMKEMTACGSLLWSSHSYLDCEAVDETLLTAYGSLLYYHLLPDCNQETFRVAVVT